MSKQVNSYALDMMNSPTGTEPILVVGINWGGGTNWFASKALAWARGNITQASSCTSERREDSLGSTGSISVTLSDYDGFMKYVHDNTLVEKAPCKAFLHYEGQPIDNMMCLLNGRVGGPVVWNEGERTLTLTLEATVEAHDAGFTPTDEFPDLAPDVIGTPWPMVFGKCAHVPTVHARRRTTGFLITPVRLQSNLYKENKVLHQYVEDDVVHAWSYLGDVDEQDKIYVRGGNKFSQGQEIKISIKGVIFTGKFDGEVFTVKSANAPAYENIQFDTRPPGDKDPTKWAIATIKDPTKNNIEGMHVYLKTVAGKVWHNYCYKQIGNVCYFACDFISPITNQQFLITSANTIAGAYAVMKNGIDNEKAWYFETLLDREEFQQKAGLSDEKISHGVSKTLFEQVWEQSDIFWHAEANEEVILWGVPDPDIYIMSCVPLVEVSGVYARREIKYPDGTRHKLLCPIPANYYEVQLQSNYQVNGAYVSGLLFYKPLHEYKDQGWDDEVFVTVTSSVGPNAADIIQYLLNIYAPDVDIENFDPARLYLDDTPANFAVFQRKNVIELCREIAWQSRCALRMDGARADLIYLPTGRYSVFTFTKSNTEQDTVALSSTSVTEIKTKLVCKWRETYKNTGPSPLNDSNDRRLLQLVRNTITEAGSPSRDTDERVYVWRENIDKYGEITEEVEVYIYNEEQYVAITAAYWGHIYANPWRTFIAKTFMNGAFMQAFDWASVGIVGFELSGYNGLGGEVREASVDFTNKSTSVTIRLDAIME